MSKVKDSITVAQKVVSTPEGMFDYKDGALLSRYKYFLQQLADDNQMALETAAALAAKYQKVNLKESECATIIGIVGLMPAVTTWNSMAMMEDIEKAWLLGTLPANGETFLGLMKGAKAGISKDIFNAFKHAVVDQKDAAGNDRPHEDKVAAIMAFGYTEQEANKLQWSGNTVMDLEGNTLSFWERAGFTANGQLSNSANDATG
jgi:hypothetical protein